MAKKVQSHKKIERAANRNARRGSGKSKLVRAANQIEDPTAQRITVSYFDPRTQQGVAIDKMLLPGELASSTVKKLVDTIAVPAMGEIKSRFGK